MKINKSKIKLFLRNLKLKKIMIVKLMNKKIKRYKKKNGIKLKKK